MKPRTHRGVSLFTINREVRGDTLPLNYYMMNKILLSVKLKRNSLLLYEWIKCPPMHFKYKRYTNCLLLTNQFNATQLQSIIVELIERCCVGHTTLENSKSPY